MSAPLGDTLEQVRQHVEEAEPNVMARQIESAKSQPISADEFWRKLKLPVVMTT